MKLPKELAHLAVEYATVAPPEPINCGSCGQPLEQILWINSYDTPPADGDVGITDCCASVLRMSLNKDLTRRMTVDEMLALPGHVRAAAQLIHTATRALIAERKAEEAVRKAAAH